MLKPRLVQDLGCAHQDVEDLVLEEQCRLYQDPAYRDWACQDLAYRDLAAARFQSLGDLRDLRYSLFLGVLQLVGGENPLSLGSALRGHRDRQGRCYEDRHIHPALAVMTSEDRIDLAAAHRILEAADLVHSSGRFRDGCLLRMGVLGQARGQDRVHLCHGQLQEEAG